MRQEHGNNNGTKEKKNEEKKFDRRNLGVHLANNNQSGKRDVELLLLLLFLLFVLFCLLLLFLTLMSMIVMIIIVCVIIRWYYRVYMRRRFTRLSFPVLVR